MAAEGLSTRKIKEVLRLKAAGRSNRVIARSLVIVRRTVAEYASTVRRPLPDWAGIHPEMKARKGTGTTLQPL